jgi:hypothetical protein
MEYCRTLLNRIVVIIHTGVRLGENVARTKYNSWVWTVCMTSHATFLQNCSLIIAVFVIVGTNSAFFNQLEKYGLGRILNAELCIS